MMMMTTTTMGACRLGAAASLMCAFAIVAVSSPIATEAFFVHNFVPSTSSPAAAFVAIPCARREVLCSRIGVQNERTEDPNVAKLSNKHLPSHLCMTADGNEGNDNTNDQEVADLDETDSNTLSWRLAKVRLEEANTRRFLKRKPIKLDYATSQKWIQRNWAPKTKAEFDDLVANGNLRTPYISKRPEEYYGERGEWISWDHYLLGECSSDDGVGNGKNGTDEMLKWQ